ncbi:hypothetical protein PspLS_03925 [Pyricularia sp. CBS 133598]|nr:hypothetical protein PspLS_03925 [Pyricularia sp. CBS 133598]
MEWYILKLSLGEDGGAAIDSITWDAEQNLALNDYPGASEQFWAAEAAPTASVPRGSARLPVAGPTAAAPRAGTVSLLTDFIFVVFAAFATFAVFSYLALRPDPLTSRFKYNTWTATCSFAVLEKLMLLIGDDGLILNLEPNENSF